MSSMLLNNQLADDSDSATVIENLRCRRKMASRGGVTDDNIKEVRAVMGPGPSDMDIIRALYQSKNDVSSALNILFDTPKWLFKPPVAGKRKLGRPPGPPPPNAGTGGAPAPASNETAVPPTTGTSNAVTQEPTWNPSLENAKPTTIEMPLQSPVRNVVRPDENNGAGKSEDPILTVRSQVSPVSPHCSVKVESTPTPWDGVVNATQGSCSQDPLSSTPVVKKGAVSLTQRCVPSVKKRSPEVFDYSLLEDVTPKIDIRRLHTKNLLHLQQEWREKLVLLGQTRVACTSTCRGMKLKVGDDLMFSFPKGGGEYSQDARRPWGRGKSAVEIVRFSSEKAGEIGRLPGDWARPLIPLVASRKVAISAVCIHSPVYLDLLDSITLQLGIFVSASLLKQFNSPSTSISVSAEVSTHNPLLSVLRLLHKKPFMKAEFSPEDLQNRKRSLELDLAKKPDSVAPGTEALLPPEKRQKLSSGGPGEEAEVEEISETDLNKIVGTSDGSELPEMEPPGTLVCDLRPYQMQALSWMTRMESGLDLEEAAKTLHPCWEAYYLGDEKSVFYVNVFSGEASREFPSALQTSRGGILADAMGLGKTVMGIALLLASPGKGGQYAESVSNSNTNKESTSTVPLSQAERSATPSSPNSQLVIPKQSIKHSTPKQKGGGTLIVCPMTLLGQWKTELETHVKPGVFSVHTYYGQDRMKDFKSLLEYDVVLTTYGVLTSDCANQGSQADGTLQGIHWFRVLLDEAHTIKNLRAQASQAAFKITADRRWCLTGTPIQNKLEDVFSLLHFLRIEPWGNFGWWNKLIQKPFDEGDERGLRLLQAILKPLMLRRTKDTLDKDGRPILVLPPADMQVIECQLSEAEQDFYEALFKKSKVKFDMFVEQGKVLHNYASILELLLRLRQCCDHPFLVMSRGDTDEFSDLNKLARHFMNGGSKPGEGPTKAYVEEVVKDLRKGEKAECPICLEVVEDAVLTSCAHCMCRECLFASWPSYGGGLCPICRQYVSRQDLITAPKESRFHLDVEKNWRASSKVEALLQELHKIRPAGEKSIVFSQWTSFLDLLQIPLKREKFRFVRLDGALSQQQREHVIKEFSTDPKILVMLISLKAGGVGINLTAASHAFLLDPWWNPAVEEQAIMRIHRIGQTKNVSIKRFICKGTVEVRMQQVQARKQRMIAGALNNEEVRAARLEELKMLFR